MCFLFLTVRDRTHYAPVVSEGGKGAFMDDRMKALQHKTECTLTNRSAQLKIENDSRTVTQLFPCGGSQYAREIEVCSANNDNMGAVFGFPTHCQRFPG